MVIYNKGDKVTPRNAGSSFKLTVDEINGSMFTTVEMPNVQLYASDFLVVPDLLNAGSINADVITTDTIAATLPEMGLNLERPTEDNGSVFAQHNKVVFKNATRRAMPGIFTIAKVMHIDNHEYIELFEMRGEIFKASEFEHVGMVHIDVKASGNDTSDAAKLAMNSAYGQMSGRAQRINGINRNDVESFREVAGRVAINTIDYYQTVATKSAIYPGQGTPLGLAYVALKLNGEAGEFAEHVGKAMRDDALIKNVPLHQHAPAIISSEPPTNENSSYSLIEINQLPSERHAALIKEAGDVLWYLSAICNELGTSLSVVAKTNLEKLCSRSERNKLQGSGDER